MRKTFDHRLLWLVSAILLVALLAVAALQHRWIGQLHDAEKERREAGLAAALEAFRQELNHEIFGWHMPLGAALAKMPDAIATDADATAVADPLAMVESLRQVARTSYVRLAEGSHWFRLDKAGGPSAVTLPSALDELLQTSSGALQIPRWLDERTLVVGAVQGHSVEDLATLREERQMRFDFSRSRRIVLVLIDRQRLAEQLVEPMARRHLPAWSGGFDYEISAAAANEDSGHQLLFGSRPTSRPDSGATSDGEITLLGAEGFAAVALGPRLGDSFLGSRTPAEARALDDTDLASCAPGASAGHTDSSQILGKATGTAGCEPATEDPDGGTEVSVFLTATSQQEAWTLQVWARDGSMAAGLDRLRRGNLAVSVLSLLVLGACLALLGLLAARSQRLARSQLEFVTGVTHELRTPLSVIHQASANLADGVIVETEDVRSYGSMIRREGQRLRDLIERVLAYAGLAGHSLPLSAVQLPPLVEGVLARHANEIGELELEVEFDLPADLPPVRANADALDAAVQNLLSNALKYGHQGGKVRIEATQEKHKGRAEVRLGVRDWGPGIDSEDRQRVFEPFYRGRSARHGQQPGTGLGLSLVARVAQLLGGRVRCEDLAGGGCVFHLHLPVAAEAEL